MKLSVMTLGCPTWDLDTILARAKQYGYDAVDFRGVAADLDITKTPAFTTDLAATARKIKNAGLEVSGISSSINACNPDKRQENLDEARRTIPVALALGAKNVRIFGGGKTDAAGNIDKMEAAKVGRDVIEEILALPDAGKLSWNFETHDHWIKSTDCQLLLDTIKSPAFGALWDIGHTSRVGGESPTQTYAAIGPRVRYTHIKDAVKNPAHPAAMKDGWAFVLPGQGTLPLAEGLKLLLKNGYTGYFLFEHEKRWQPLLDDAEVAFPAFVQWIRRTIPA